MRSALGGFLDFRLASGQFKQMSERWQTTAKCQFLQAFEYASRVLAYLKGVWINACLKWRFRPLCI